MRKKIALKKREKGSNIIFPVILRLLGGISSYEKMKGTEILEKKIKMLQKKWGMWMNVKL